LVLTRKKIREVRGQNIFTEIRGQNIFTLSQTCLPPNLYQFEFEENKRQPVNPTQKFFQQNHFQTSTKRRLMTEFQLFQSANPME
jgi:hypothetical protein